jgi:hypothetical protein
VGGGGACGIGGGDGAGLRVSRLIRFQMSETPMATRAEVAMS